MFKNTFCGVGLTVVLSVALAGCSREAWPVPPAVDQNEYKSEYNAWREERIRAITHAVQIIGLWPLQEGETAFGSAPSLPIALPKSAGPAKAGVFRREGTRITLIPSPGAPLRLEDGTAISEPTELKTVMDKDTTVIALGSLRLQVEQVFEAYGARRWISVWDEDHPVVKNPPTVEAYPPDDRWRLAARFDAFMSPKRVRIPDVRGGFIDLTAVGELVFRLNDQEQRVTAIKIDGSEQFFVMFKDATNLTTTYSGYRIVFPGAVADKEWTILDFNMAVNPPCAYSRYTTCPLPPPENTLKVAIEAGEKRYPAAQGYTPSL